MAKILFICGSLEPNRDGVGDYVWKLANSLHNYGFSSTCVSINDNFVDPAHNYADLTDSKANLRRYRISASTSWKEKIKTLNIIAQNENPFLISFQYVPYAYSSKGLPIQLLKWIPKLNYKCYWHLMLHELWVDPSLKAANKLLSPVQRTLLQKLVHRISPSIINTTNSYYVNQLLRIGVKSQILPIFSNIDYIEEPTITQVTNSWRFLFFGSIHPEWDHDYLLNAIDKARVRSNISLCTFILIGHAGDYGVKLWTHLAAKLRSNFIFQNLGVLSAMQISHQLQIADFGITTTPSHLVEKSGSVAAMLAHGLPVIIPRVTNDLPEFNKTLEGNNSYILFNKDSELRLMPSVRQDPVDQLQSSTKLFADSLLSLK